MKTRNITSVAAVLAALSLGTLAHAAGGDVGEAAKQSTNWTAIAMFGLFVAGTMYLVKRRHEANQREFDSVAGLDESHH